MSVSAPTAVCRFPKTAIYRSVRRKILSRGIHTTSTRHKEESSGAGFQKPIAETPPSQPPSSPHRPNRPQNYPLYPSVAHLLRQNNIPVSSASSIPATGPAGRLLKGDVLAHLGRIQKEYSKNESSRISALGHLDLKNYQKAPAPSKPTDTKAKAAAPPPHAAEAEPDTQIALPISLSAVLQTQARIQQSLGLTLPLSTFVARASEIANQDLPRAHGKAPTADELFDAVLGLDRVAVFSLKPKAKTEKGTYAPQMTTLAPSDVKPSSPATKRSSKAPLDIIDVLAGSPRPTNTKAVSATGAMRVASPGAKSVFSVAAKKGEEKRARTYLERVKTVLEAEPGRCVL